MNIFSAIVLTLVLYLYLIILLILLLYYILILKGWQVLTYIIIEVPI